MLWSGFDPVGTLRFSDAKSLAIGALAEGWINAFRFPEDWAEKYSRWTAWAAGEVKRRREKMKRRRWWKRFIFFFEGWSRMCEGDREMKRQVVELGGYYIWHGWLGHALFSNCARLLLPFLCYFIFLYLI